MRVVADEHGNAEEVNDYYPFGGLMSTSSRQSVQPYKYNGKELETACGVNWYDYGARRYDPVLGTLAIFQADLLSRKVLYNLPGIVLK